MEALAEESGLKLDVESYGMYGMDLVHPEGPEVAWTAGVSDADSDTLQGRSYYVTRARGRRLDVGPDAGSTDLRRDPGG